MTVVIAHSTRPASTPARSVAHSFPEPPRETTDEFVSSSTRVPPCALPGRIVAIRRDAHPPTLRRFAAPRYESPTRYESPPPTRETTFDEAESAAWGNPRRWRRTARRIAGVAGGGDPPRSTVKDGAPDPRQRRETRGCIFPRGFHLRHGLGRKRHRRGGRGAATDALKQSRAARGDEGGVGVRGCRLRPIGRLPRRSPRRRSRSRSRSGPLRLGDARRAAFASPPRGVVCSWWRGRPRSGV